jgi:threonine/homoserine/homoserine lactone efflux protein
MLTFATIFVTSFVVALSGALMPGPLFTVTVSESSRRGAGAGPLLILGHGILELTLVAALMLGVGPLLKKEPVFVATALAGSVVLFWMAYGMLRGLPRLSLAVEAERGTGGNLVLAGIVLSLANPYWTIWWVSIGLGYITHSLKVGIWGVAVFFAGHILADLAWYSAVSTAVWKGKRFMSDRVYRGLIGACALFLIVFAGMFGYAGLQRLI